MLPVTYVLHIGSESGRGQGHASRSRPWAAAWPSYSRRTRSEARTPSRCTQLRTIVPMDGISAAGQELPIV